VLLYTGLVVTEFLVVEIEVLASLVPVLLPDCETPDPGDLREAEAAELASADLVAGVFVPEPPDK
jgi:hypothetical protein